MMKNNGGIKIIVPVAMGLLTIMWGVFIYIQKLDQDRMARIEKDIDRLAHTKLEIQAISNYVASSTVEIENTKESTKKNQERIEELYRILNR